MTKALHEFTNAELAAMERDYPAGDHPLYRLNLKAEIERRHNQRTRRYTLASTIIAAIAAIASAAAAIASWLTILSHH
jgi:hypothetical protein